MGTESSLKPSRTGSAATTVLVLASLGLNVFLVAHLLHRRPSLPPQPASATSTQSKQPGVSTAAPVATNAMTDTTATNEPPPFLWSQIESADYRQYIANLRAVGCPEEVIRDIIAADVNQAFVPRFTAIWKPQVREYWRKSKPEQPSPEQEKQLMALSKDKTAILQELLGVHLEEQQMINTIHLQVYGNEQNLLFLPADRREAALQALADADFETKSAEVHAHAGYSNEVDRDLFNEALQTLAKVLTPAELEEFRLRSSPTANALRNEVQYFNCTPEEFRQLVDSREHASEKNLGDPLNRTAASEEVRKLLGDERAKEFERVTDMFYINTRRAVEEQGAPLESVEQAWQVTRDVRAAAVLVVKNSNLSAEERTRQTQALMQPAEARLIELLGSKAAFGVIRDLRVVVNAKPSP
jgi:hypothetical protein